MTASLPRLPSLEHLKKQAKQLLAAQRNGMVQCCPFLRRLHRFSHASDQEILGAEVSLAEVQYVVAMHYGFSSWAKLREEIGTRPDAGVDSIDAVVARSRDEIPEYAGAGVPLGVVAALNHAGIDIDFMEFAAATGWAFSFGYSYDDISAAYMGVRGNPKDDGPFEVFAFLPLQYGLDYQMARTAEPDELWAFVRDHIDAGVPIMSEHMDGGLITGYRDRSRRRQLYFDGTAFPGWIDVEKLNPYAVYAFVKRGEARPRDEIRQAALERAVAKGRPHMWKGTPQGMAALQRYLADVADISKDFADSGEWFCWATFERLMARRCCEVWLRRTASELNGEVCKLISEAALGYGEAFQWYDRYRVEVGAGERRPRSNEKTARTPNRIAATVGLLESGIKAESAGLEALTQAVALG
jgi:hypothetical protein